MPVERSPCKPSLWWWSKVDYEIDNNGNDDENGCNNGTRNVDDNKIEDSDNGNNDNHDKDIECYACLPLAYIFC